MPLINVIRGESSPTAPFTVRTPVLRRAVKALSWMVVTYVRYWWATGPTTGLLWLYAEYGWVGPAATVGGIAAVATGWGFGHRPSFLRFGWYPVLARFRRWIYRRR